MTVYRYPNPGWPVKYCMLPDCQRERRRVYWSTEPGKTIKRDAVREYMRKRRRSPRNPS